MLRATGVTRRRPTLHKGRGSAQGIAAGVLADACGKSLTLTGTLLGGYSSTLFHLLYRFSPEIRTEFGRSEEHRWVTRYGFLEHTINHGDDGFDEDGRVSRRRSYRKEALADALSKGSKRLLATYLQTLLAYPDGCTRGETVFDPRTQDLLVQVPPLDGDRLYPKEKALLDLVEQERRDGRGVLVYATHTGTRDITQRMEGFLSRHGYRVAVMKADAVPPERREAWVADKVKEGMDVLICHPRLVQTGLDLVDFPTIVWFETDYSVYVMRQASRRSWRIGQTRPVKVVFMAYRNTLQADALKLVAKKLQSSLAVEGELPEDGLAAYGDDLMLALARKLVNGDADDAESVEAVFAQAQNAESEAEELLVDEGWKLVENEPEVVGANGNSNGQHADSLPRTGYGGIGPTVELGLDNGHTVSGNGNGHHDEDPEPQQSLFSWAEFMSEEPVKGNGRQPATLSMFEWAMSMEQEREEEPVGAER